MSLKAHRLNLGLSVEQLAEAVDVKPASIYYMERKGARPRDPQRALRIAEFFNVQVTDLWPVEDNRSDGWRGDRERTAA